MSFQKKAIARKAKRVKKIRGNIRRLKAIRLSVDRSSKHIGAQIFDLNGNVLVAASTKEAMIAEAIKYTGNCEAASHVGKILAERAIAAGVKQIAFDRSGYLYHGRVEALAKAARENGLQF